MGTSEGKGMGGMNLCGVCNEPVPVDHASLVRNENEKGFTIYHIKCEDKIPKKPCEDCDRHRLFCSECAEYGM